MFEYDDKINKTYSAQTITAIEKYLYQATEEISVEENPLEFRKHLGASIIGDECSRAIWYNWRWVKLAQFSGRMRRLFNRGKKEEENFRYVLYKLGFHVREIDPLTDKQYCFSAIGGHYGGSSDSLVLLPWDKGNDGQRVLAEYKTHNKKSFDDLEKRRVKLSKPKHWAQMCAYGFEFKTRYGLYCGLCKDNDAIHYELLELDWNYAQQLKNKAQDIILAQTPPQKISSNPAYYYCKFCHFNSICHYGQQVEINCRSCKMAEPKDNTKWWCNKFQSEIPEDFIAKGCKDHVSINVND